MKNKIMSILHSTPKIWEVVLCYAVIIMVALLIESSLAVVKTNVPKEVPRISAPDKYIAFSEAQAKELRALERQLNENFRRVMQALRTHDHDTI